MSIDTWSDVGSGFETPNFPTIDDRLSDWETRGLQPGEILRVADELFDNGTITPDEYSEVVDKLTDTK